MRDLLSISDVAHLLGCCSRTIARYIDRGQIPTPLRVGGLIRWPRVEIENWLAGSR